MPGKFQHKGRQQAKQFKGRFKPRRKPVSKKRQIDSAEAKRKWMHHSLKILARALKKAKTFEVRKIQRRIGQSKDEASKPGQAGADVAKLQAQLEIAKGADVDQLAKQVAEKGKLGVEPVPAAPDAPSDAATAATAGPSEGTVAAEEAGQAPRTAQDDQAAAAAAVSKGNGLAEAVHQRLMRAGCVRKQLEDCAKEFNQKFGTSNKAKKGAVASAGEGASGSGDDSSEEGGDGGGDLSEGGEEPPEEVDDPTALAALDKLMKSRSNKSKHVRLGSPEGSDDEMAAVEGAEEEEEEEDSGIIEDVGEGEEEEDEDDAGMLGRSSEDLGSGSEDGGSDGGLDDSASFNSEDFDQGTGGRDNLGSSEPGSASGGGSEDPDDELEAVRLAARKGSGKHAGTSVKAESKAEAAAAAGELGGKDVKRKGSGAEDSKGTKDKEGSKGKDKEGSKGKDKEGSKGKDKEGSKGKDKEGSKEQQLDVKKKGKKDKYDPKKDDPLLGAKRKNRPGQHYRRLMAEKMYGRDANHVKKQKFQDQKPRKDQSRGTQQGPAGKPVASAGAGKAPAASGSGGASSKGQDAEQLHPSWAAKRKQQQPLILPAAGKKIKFDDDGAQAVTVRSSGSAAGPSKPQGAASGRNSQAARKPPADKGPAATGTGLHPSWEAKKLQKQQMAKLPQPAGKKIVFDD